MVIPLSRSRSSDSQGGTSGEHDLSSAPPSTDAGETYAVDDGGAGELPSMLNLIIAQISERGAALASEVRSSYSARIRAARHSGLSREAIAGAIMGLREEQRGALHAVAEQTQVELAGAQTAAIAAGYGRPGQQSRHSRVDHHGGTRDKMPRRLGSRASLIRSFKDAAKAASSPTPAAPRSKRRGGGGGGMVSFRPAARMLVFRPTKLPAEAYGHAVAFLSDTLHWLSLWHDPATDMASIDAGSPMQNFLFPSL